MKYVIVSTWYARIGYPGKKGREKDKDTGHRLVSPSLSYDYTIILGTDHFTCRGGVMVLVNGQKVTGQKVTKLLGQKVTGQKVTIYIFYPGGQKVTGQKVTTYIFA
jgi:hypothetical protein